VFLPGGGPLADAVRTWDERFNLGQESSHWLCADLLDTTANLLLHLLPGQKKTCDHWRQLRPAAATCIIVFRPAHFLRVDEPGLPGDKLPCSWDVTSDSIAARLAKVCGAEELVLLKSGSPPEHATLSDLAGGYVDAHFPRAAAAIPRVTFVNLRGARKEKKPRDRCGAS
jgi:aspartokinase-like uncharacterized kinase